MTKSKQKPVQLNAVWEIIETADYLENVCKDRKITKLDLIQIYRGNFMPCLLDERIPTKHLWNIKFTARFKDSLESEQIYTDTLDWDFSAPLTFNQILRGDSNVLITDSGFKTVWQGISHEWSLYLRKHLKGKYVLDVWATATTSSKVKPIKVTDRYTNIASGLNKDFRTGKYLL